MNNQQLIESLEYHINEQSSENTRNKMELYNSVKKKRKEEERRKVSRNIAGFSGGAVGAAAGWTGGKKLANASKTSKKLVFNSKKGIIDMKYNPVKKSFDPILPSRVDRILSKPGVAKIAKHGRAIGAVGGAVASGVLAKKAYDHFHKKANK